MRHLRRKIGPLPLASLVILLIVGCQSREIKNLKLNVYAGDYEKEGIRDRNDHFIFASEPAFNEYGCLHREEIKKLMRVIGGKRNYPLKGELNELLIELSDDPIARTIRQEREKQGVGE